MNPGSASRLLLPCVLAALVWGCAGNLLTDNDAPLSGLPLLDGAALRLDNSYRVEAFPLPADGDRWTFRDLHPGAPAQVLILVVRSDEMGFRFEGIDELGMPVLTWPTRAGLPVLPIDAGTVARLVQLALAPAHDWQVALVGAPWRLELTAGGVRRLSMAGVDLVYVGQPTVLASGARVRRLGYCPRGFTLAGACPGADGWVIVVTEIDDWGAP
jgi:hypothetical protein